MLEKMQLITKMWAPLATEYAKFLNRHNLETISIVSGETYVGVEISIFADGAEYLRLAQDDSKFHQEEDQLTELLKTIEEMYYILRDVMEEDYYYDEEIDDEDYEYADYDDEDFY